MYTQQLFHIIVKQSQLNFTTSSLHFVNLRLRYFTRITITFASLINQFALSFRLPTEPNNISKKKVRFQPSSKSVLADTMDCPWLLNDRTSDSKTTYSHLLFRAANLNFLGANEGGSAMAYTGKKMKFLLK